MKIENIQNPRWANSSHTLITVDFDLDGEAVSFVASPNDCTDYGPKIYQDCIDGKYGDIADFSIPEKTPEQLESIAQSELDRRLKAIMTTENLALAEVDDEFKKNYKAKIKELLDVKKQKGWPNKITWPDEEE
ncbi:MAG TPA: hypothetical protein DE117_05310 [Fervidobacterium sp.]|nr:hypothetical protein [Fervidobacterium sp.]